MPASTSHCHSAITSRSAGSKYELISTVVMDAFGALSSIAPSRSPAAGRTGGALAGVDDETDRPALRPDADRVEGHPHEGVLLAGQVEQGHASREHVR